MPNLIGWSYFFVKNLKESTFEDICFANMRSWVHEILNKNLDKVFNFFLKKEDYIICYTQIPLSNYYNYISSTKSLSTGNMVGPRYFIILYEIKNWLRVIYWFKQQLCIDRCNSYKQHAANRYCLHGLCNRELRNWKAMGLTIVNQQFFHAFQLIWLGGPLYIKTAKKRGLLDPKWSMACQVIQPGRIHLWALFTRVDVNLLLTIWVIDCTTNLKASFLITFLPFLFLKFLYCLTVSWKVTLIEGTLLKHLGSC